MAFGFVLILVQRDGKPQTARCSGLSYPLFSLGGMPRARPPTFCSKPGPFFQIFSTIFFATMSKVVGKKNPRGREALKLMEQILDSALSKNRSNSAGPPEKTQETAWVLASQRGDTVAFNRLVLKWEKPIYNLCLRMLRDSDEAAEATQEVFLLAFKSVRRFRLHSQFSTWLYRIAANYCTSRLRKRPAGVHLSLDGSEEGMHLRHNLPASGSHERDFLQAESDCRIRSALEFLQPEQRIVVELKFFQNLTFEEIAGILETPLSTVKSRLYHGLESLKERLGGSSRTRRQRI
jgi:RNA polymerase sigma-70 factor, ECF subfamily